VSIFLVLSLVASIRILSSLHELFVSHPHSLPRVLPLFFKHLIKVLNLLILLLLIGLELLNLALLAL